MVGKVSDLDYEDDVAHFEDHLHGQEYKRQTSVLAIVQNPLLLTRHSTFERDI